MKRLAALLLLHLYLFFSGSRVLAFHYCGGSLAETRINALASCCCEELSNSPNDDCCQDTIKTVKHPDTTLYSLQSIVKAPIASESPFLPTTISTLVPVKSLHTPESTKHGYDPPDTVEPLPAYLQFHALLLYA